MAMRMDALFIQGISDVLSQTIAEQSWHLWISTEPELGSCITCQLEVLDSVGDICREWPFKVEIFYSSFFSKQQSSADALLFKVTLCITFHASDFSLMSRSVASASESRQATSTMWCLKQCYSWHCHCNGKWHDLSLVTRWCPTNKTHPPFDVTSKMIHTWHPPWVSQQYWHHGWCWGSTDAWTRACNTDGGQDHSKLFAIDWLEMSNSVIPRIHRLDLMFVTSSWIVCSSYCQGLNDSDLVEVVLQTVNPLTTHNHWPLNLHASITRCVQMAGFILDLLRLHVLWSPNYKLNGYLPSPHSHG